MTLTIQVYGTPAPQGSKRHVGRGIMVESSAKVKPWREAVKWAALEQHAPLTPLSGAVKVLITFRLPRPRSHYGTGKNAETIKDSAPIWPGVRPDLDKLLRSTLDALGEAGVWRDDCQVVQIDAWKVFDEFEPAGARIVVTALDIDTVRTTLRRQQ